MGDSVVVVGAGPTGLVLACGLLSAGVSTRVVDQADGPATTSRALGLQPRGVEVLDRVGALRDLPGRAVGIQRVVIHFGDGKAAQLRVGQPTRLVRRPGLLVSQAEIEAELRRRLADLGGTIEWASRVEAVSPGPNRVTLHTAAGHSDHDWVVGCDGARSAVRKSAGIAFPGVPLVEGFLLADVRADLPLSADAAVVWLRGQEMFAAFPLPGGVWRFMAPAPDSTVDSAAEDVPAIMTRLMADRAGLAASAVSEWEWTSVFRIHRRLADTYRRGRVLLAGDAAHIHSPFGGQGMNTGVGDAENLAWRLGLVASGRAGTALLDGYERERRPVATEVLRSTTGLTGLVMGDSVPARLVRDRLILPLMNLPLTQTLIWEKASQLRVGYARGLPRRRPRIGDRMPRFTHDNGFRWTLAAPPDADGCAAAAREYLGDAVHTTTTTERHLLLIRPDGHLAWRGQANPAALRAGLAGMLHR